MPETKHEKFGRLARARLDKIRRQAGLLINLAGPNYEYEQKDVDWLRDQLYCIVDETLAAFDRPKELN